MSYKQKYSVYLNKSENKYCSRVCFAKSPHRIEKIRITQFDTYGSLGFNTEKQKQTMLARYGVQNGMQYLPTKNSSIQTRHPHLKNRSEIENLAKWANNFANSFQRKPLITEANSYFNQNHIEIRVRRQNAEPYFNMSSKSGWESAIEEILVNMGLSLNIDYSRNKRPIKTTLNNRLELDIIFLNHNAAIEVQDFTTHSKITDDEIVKFNGKLIKKRGPAYHLNKKTLAKEQLDIEILEVWEDDIRSGKAFQIVEDFVRRKGIL